VQQHGCLAVKVGWHLQRSKTWGLTNMRRPVGWFLGKLKKQTGKQDGKWRMSLFDPVVNGVNRKCVWTTANTCKRPGEQSKYRAKAQLGAPRPGTKVNQ
jgi:hypothetical protein